MLLGRWIVQMCEYQENAMFYEGGGAFIPFIRTVISSDFQRFAAANKSWGTWARAPPLAMQGRLLRFVPELYRRGTCFTDPRPPFCQGNTGVSLNGNKFLGRKSGRMGMSFGGGNQGEWE